MRSLIWISLLFLLAGCAGSRDQQAEKHTDTREVVEGVLHVPIPATDPLKLGQWEIKPVKFAFTKMVGTVERGTVHETTKNTVDTDEMVAKITSSIASAVGGATGFDLTKIGALLAAALTGGKAIHSQLQTRNVSRALRQTVDGISSARKALGEVEWKAKVAPILKESQDEDVKKYITNIEPSKS